MFPPPRSPIPRPHAFTGIQRIAIPHLSLIVLTMRRLRCGR